MDEQTPFTPQSPDGQQDAYNGDNSYSQQTSYTQQNTYGQQTSYTQQNTYGQQSPYGQQNAYGQQSPYGQQNAYGQQSPYGQQNAYGQQSPYGQQNAYGQQSPYGQQNAYGQQNPYGQNPYGSPNGGRRLTKSQFFNHPALVTMKKNITACGIFCYIIAGINVILGIYYLSQDSLFIASKSLGAGCIVSALIITGLGLGVHLAKSRACAIIILIYASLNTLLALVYYGKFQGWLIILAGVYSVIWTFKIQQAYTQYETTGSYPGVY